MGENRQKLVYMFYTLDSKNQEKCFTFVYQRRRQGKDVYKKYKSRRSRILSYYLPTETGRVKVCQQFIPKTLDISERSLY